MRHLLAIMGLLLAINGVAQPKPKPVRMAVAGISHDHVPWILGRKNKDDIQLVGIYEKDTTLWQRAMKRYSLPKALFFSDLDRMLDAVKPEAVVVFGSINQHLAAVEACAPRKIHVMVEKPLAVTNEQAERMQQLAKENNIHLLTNFETSWYPTTEKTYQLVRDSGFVGKISKTVFHHGHEGPKKINVSREFFNWLTDPVENGGGALIDFGCYGANIMTYLMQDEAPVSVTAVTQHLQPDVYPKVDDEATIVVTYPSAQAIIQASWNWPFGRKDMEVYGDEGYVIVPDRNNMRVRNRKQKQEAGMFVTEKEPGVYTDPFSYFVDVINGKIKIPKYGPYSLENNLRVVQILDAARESAKTGKTVMFR
ncbi:MAG: Gfo/Idh/MocA family oxidoreductase [Chitinophagaceae bacterium]|nr:Gfo/Idh/MocA family oxidoreductase [Chitinophagaceae bacterium]